MSDEIKTVEVPEPVATEESRPTMTIEQAKENGWGAKEIESGLKRKMLAEEPSPEDKAKQETEAKVKAEAEAKAKEAPIEKKEVKAPSNFLADMDKELTPEQEKVFLEMFPPGTKPRAFYFRAKNERHSRQAAEARVRELEARLEEANKARVEKKSILDEEGNEIDPDDKPLTLKQLRELQKQEAEEYEKKQSEQKERAQRVTEAQQFQEEYAKAVIKEQGLPDYDDTVKKATELMTNLDAMIPDQRTKTRVVKLWRELQTMAANADKIGVEDDNAAFLAYEIGKYHPDYGKQAEKVPNGQTKDPKASGGLTPEQMKKVEQNTQRRSSSAAIPSGGGRRTVTAEEVTPEDLNRMSFTERAKFKQNHPEQYARLVRG